jgi:hypothetical protein
MNVSRNKIERLIEEAERERLQLGSYAYLPEIIATLRSLLVNVTEKGSIEEAVAQQVARGLGRLVTEDFRFSESALGGRLLHLVDELSKRNN